MSVPSVPAEALPTDFDAAPDEVPAEADVEVTYSRREEPEDWESEINVAKLAIRE